MQRLKLILVLAIVGLIGVVTASLLSDSQKVVVLNPVRIVPEQVAASAGVSKTTILRISSTGVSVLAPGQTDWQEGVGGMELVAGSRIKTDATGRAQVEYPGGSVTRLDHESEILLETVNMEEANIVVKVLGGRIWSRVSKILGRISYETRSTNVVASVRGTEYEHDITDGVDRVMVAESSVDVSCINGKKRALLKLAEKMSMDCGDGQVTIKEIITSETVDEATESGVVATMIENVEESELDDDWREYNKAKDVIKNAKNKFTEKSDEITKNEGMTISEKVKGEVDVNKSEEKNNDVEKGGDLVRDSERKMSEWWSRFSEWRSRDNKNGDGSVGRLRLKCDGSCDKLVLETERQFNQDEDLKIDIYKADGKKVRLENLEYDGKVVRSRINEEDICSGGVFALDILYGNGSRIEYGKFDSNDLGCNK